MVVFRFGLFCKLSAVSLSDDPLQDIESLEIRLFSSIYINLKNINAHNRSSLSFSFTDDLIWTILFNPQAPVAQKIADDVVFRRFQREGVEFFKIGPH